MSGTPVNAWPLPDFTTTPADGSAAFQALGTAIENTVKAGAPADFTPVWTSVSSPQPSAPLVSVCKWALQGGICSIAFYVGFGPSTYGGRGSALFSLPRPAVAAYPEQWLRARMYVSTAGAFLGGAQILGGESVLRLYFPLSMAIQTLGAFQNSNAAGAVGTGIPASFAGDLAVQNGGNIVVTGRYAAT